MTDLKFSVLKGKTLANIEGNAGDDVMTFTTVDREVYCLSDSTGIALGGSLADIVGFPLTTANRSGTFYRLSTLKGTVMIERNTKMTFERVS